MTADISSSENAPSAPTPPIRAVERCLFGAAGAIAPIVVAGATIDPDLFFRTDVVTIAGWSFRIFMLLLVGGFFGYMYSVDKKPLDIFLAGLSAPALITTAIAGTQNPARNAALDFDVYIARSAFAAQENVQGVAENSPPTVYDLCKPRRSVLVRFFGGVWGQSSDTLETWWLSSDWIDERQKVIKLYDEIKPLANDKGMKPKIFSTTNGKYILVLEINLSANQAQDPSLWNINGPLTIRPKPFLAILKEANVNTNSLATCHFLPD
ncbi:hypothetical protein [Azospirillum doebereinerae]